MIECPGCGSNLLYDIARQKMSCKSCGMVYDVEAVERQNDGEDANSMEINMFICPQCAGEIYSTDDAATGFCSYCGASTMLSSRLKSERKPEYIIPFVVTKERCKDIYLEMMKKAIYAPKELKSREHIKEFRGIYMPYWLCDVEQDGPVEFMAEDSYYSGDYRIINTYELKAYVKSRCNDIAVEASSLFADNISEKIGPFGLNNMKRFSTGYLSGFYADLPDVDYDVYKDDIMEVANNQNFASVCEFAYEKTIKRPSSSLSSVFHPYFAKTKTALLPVWFMSYKNGNRIAYATVNGQNGKVVADIPMDIKKFLLGCLLGTIPLFFLFETFLTIRPVVLLVIVALLGLVASSMHSKGMNQIGISERHEDDKGLAGRHTLNVRLERERIKREQIDNLSEKYGEEGASFIIDDTPVIISTTKKNKSKKKKVKENDKKVTGTLDAVIFVILALILFGVMFNQIISEITDGISVEQLIGYSGYVLVPIACIISCVNAVKAVIRVRDVKKKSGLGGIWIAFALIFATLIEIIQPAADQPYYIACALVGVGAVLTLADVVFSYNRLATRPLPQFDYQGGDNRA